MFLALVHRRVSTEESFLHQLGTAPRKHANRSARPTSRRPHFNIRYLCSTNSRQTTGFCVQVDEIADVLHHDADRRSIMCIWHTHLVCTPSRCTHTVLPCLIPDWTVGIPRNHNSASTYARYRITQSASVHAIRGQGVDLACTTSVVSVHSCPHSQQKMVLALQSGQASAWQDCLWTTQPRRLSFPSTNPV